MKNLKKLVTFLFVAAFALSGNLVLAQDEDATDEAIHEETTEVPPAASEAVPAEGTEEKPAVKREKKAHHKKHAKKAMKKKMAKKKGKKKHTIQ